MKVRIYSSSTIMSSALFQLVSSLGFEVCDKDETGIDVALVDLLSNPQYPLSPFDIPSLILAKHEDQSTELDFLLQGYRGCIYFDTPRAMLQKALQALTKGEIWTKRLVLSQLLDICLAEQRSYTLEA